MKLRFAFLGLAIALTGCPNPGPETNDKQDSQASPSPDDKEPAIEISTLGLVTATIQGAQFELGQPRYRIYADLGYLRTKGNEDAQLGLQYYKAHSDGIAGHYASADPATYTHAFQEPPLTAIGEAIGATMGGMAATSRKLDPNFLDLVFPAGAKGDLVLTRQEGSELLYRTSVYGASSYYTVFEPTYVIQESALNHYAYHDATASLTVSVKELNGNPSPGLTDKNFKVSTGGALAVVTEAKETSKGVYQVVAALSNLSGQAATSRKLTLTLVNPAIRQEVTP